MWSQLAQQPQLPRLAVHAAGGGVPGAVPGLPARARHLALVHRRQDRHARASSSGSRTTSGSSATASSRRRCSSPSSTRSSPASSSSRVGLYLAILLNEKLPFKAIIRAVVLIPFIVPTVLSAIAFWWIFDPQFSVISWSLKKIGLITGQHQLPRRRLELALLGDLRQRLARRALHRDLAAGRAADRAAVALRGGHARRRVALADVRQDHLPAADADHRGGDDLLGAVHVHRFPAHQGAHQRRSGRRHRADGDDELQHRDPRRAHRRGLGDLDGDGAVPARRDHGLVVRPAAAQVAGGGSND